MWAFSLIPDSVMTWIINIILLIGLAGLVAGFFLKIIPFVNQYRLPVQILSIVLLTLGVWLKGGESERRVWQERVRQMEERVAVAEQRAREENVRIETQLAERTAALQAEAQVIIREVPRYITREVDNRCEIPTPAIDLFNRAAQGQQGQRRQ